MNEHTARLSTAKMSTEVANERVNPDALEGLCDAMESIELAASLRVSEILPVGSLVARACEAWLLDEGFQQNRTVGVAGMPVIRQAPADAGEEVRGEVAVLDPRQDEESGVVDDEVQIAGTLLTREHLFRPFFTTKERGTGLGLASSRAIAEAHEGSIGFENVLSGGTRFWLRLPASAKQEESTP